VAVEVTQELGLEVAATVRTGGYIEVVPWPPLKSLKSLGHEVSAAVHAGGRLEVGRS
jgi:hypothetical protein